MDYCQDKTNKAADTLSHFLQKSRNEEKKSWAENTQIFYYLQSSLSNASFLNLD